LIAPYLNVEDEDRSRFSRPAVSEAGPER